VRCVSFPRRVPVNRARLLWRVSSPSPITRARPRAFACIRRRQLRLAKAGAKGHKTSAKATAEELPNEFWAHAAAAYGTSVFLGRSALAMRRQLHDAQFLVEGHPPAHIYFELVDCLRRLGIALVPLALERGSAAQQLCGLLISIAFALGYALGRPFGASAITCSR